MWKYILIIILTSSNGKVKECSISFEGNREKAKVIYELLKILNERDTAYIRLDSVDVDKIIQLQ